MLQHAVIRTAVGWAEGLLSWRVFILHFTVSDGTAEEQTKLSSAGRQQASLGTAEQQNTGAASIAKKVQSLCAGK